MPLLSVKDLTVVFPAELCSGTVDTVSFDLAEGECMAIVGESGSGKSMICQAVIRLVPEPGRIAAGRVVFDRTDMLTCSTRQLRQIRGGEVGMVFQDPSSTLPIRSSPSGAS